MEYGCESALLDLWANEKGVKPSMGGVELEEDANEIPRNYWRAIYWCFDGDEMDLFIYLFICFNFINELLICVSGLFWWGKWPNTPRIPYQSAFYYDFD